MTVLALEQVELLKVAIQVVTLLVPAVRLAVNSLLWRKMLILVCPHILSHQRRRSSVNNSYKKTQYTYTHSQHDCAVRFKIRKCIKQVRQLACISFQVNDIVIASIDAPVAQFKKKRVLLRQLDAPQISAAAYSPDQFTK